MLDCYVEMMLMGKPFDPSVFSSVTAFFDGKRENAYFNRNSRPLLPVHMERGRKQPRRL